MNAAADLTFLESFRVWSVIATCAVGSFTSSFFITTTFLGLF